jgi:hypothetical protein
VQRLGLGKKLSARSGPSLACHRHAFTKHTPEATKFFEARDSTRAARVPNTETRADTKASHPWMDQSTHSSHAWPPLTLALQNSCRGAHMIPSGLILHPARLIIRVARNQPLLAVLLFLKMMCMKSL